MWEKSSSNIPLDEWTRSKAEEALPTLACHAAVELDNLVLNRGESLSAVRELAELISKSGSASNYGTQTNGFPLPYLSPAIAVAFNAAISDSKIAIALTTVDDLIKEADHLANNLKKLLDDPKKAREKDVETTKKVRAFCLALSKRALANEPPLYDIRPEHPHRR